MKTAGIFILKSVTFSLIFLTMSVLVLSVFYNFNNRVSASSSTATTNIQAQQQNDSATLMQKYWSQAAESDKTLEIGKKQQTQIAAQLKKQDELLARWEKVIERWEKAPAK
jgi:hypothetical protein